MSALRNAVQHAIDALKDTGADGRVDPRDAADYLIAALALPDAQPVTLPRDAIVVNLMRITLINKHVARDCADVVLAMLATVPQPAIAPALALPDAQPVAWTPAFDAISPSQEALVVELCAEIAGKKGCMGNPPDPVRLLEMAQELYEAERDDFCEPQPAIAPAPVLLTDDEIDNIVARHCKRESSHADADRTARAIEAAVHAKQRSRQ